MLEMYLIPALAALLFGVAFTQSDPEETGDPTAPYPSIGGDGDGDGPDLLTIDNTVRGTVDAGAGNDTISVDGGADARLTVVTPLQLDWDTETGEEPLQILGGAGDDTITLTGQGLAVSGGDGADTITLDSARNVAVYAGDMDTVFGQDAEDQPLPQAEAPVRILLDGAAVFEGGSADDSVATNGTGAVVNAGGGDDRVLSFGGAVAMKGGEGDDTLIGSIDRNAFAPSATDRLSYYTSTDADTLNGGGGDDVLWGSHDDLLTGGDGADTFLVYSDVGADMPGATITDFNAAQDRVIVFFDSFGSPGGSATESPATLPGRITTDIGPDGSQRVLGDDQVLVTLNGTAGLRVGLQGVGGQGTYTTLDGTAAAVGDFDVIVQMFNNISS